LAIAAALDEDLGGEPGRDVTTQATIPDDAHVTGDVVVRDPGVVAALTVIGHTLGQVATRLGLPKPRVTVLATDGDRVAAGTTVAQIAGPGHVVLIAERTILNFMSRACGIATHTRQWADALEGTPARVLDTRKTTPGLRELEKYAVRCGGGTNKRMGLFDCAMVKDNHIVAAGSVSGAIAAIRSTYPGIPIQVEVERTAQAIEAIEAGVRFLMLDNMSLDAMRALVTEVRALEASVGRVRLEATGGLTLANAREVAMTGVDFMSVGALTHSSPILDVALDLH
jgi:nicotinate-nucleotide pyrophosphorylase (carboxylating)